MEAARRATPGDARRRGSPGAVAYDARGHGDSEWDADQNYTLGGFVSDLLAVVRTQPHPLVFVGAPLGGITSLIATAENPGLARGLVLIDVVAEVEPRGAARMLDFLTAHRDGFASLDEVADAIAAYNPHRPRPRDLDGLHKNVRLRSDGRWYWHWDPASIKIGDEPRRQADPQRLRAAAANVQVPTLLVRGAQSDVVTDAGIEDMKPLIPSAESIVVQNAGHMVAGTTTRSFSPALNASWIPSGRKPPGTGS